MENDNLKLTEEDKEELNFQILLISEFSEIGKKFSMKKIEPAIQKLYDILEKYDYPSNILKELASKNCYISLSKILIPHALPNIDSMNKSIKILDFIFSGKKIQ